MLALCATGAAVVALSVPFRVPRNLVEVLMVPAIVNLIGVAWLLLGATFVTRLVSKDDLRAPTVAIPVAMLIALLVFFQAVLRGGFNV